MLGGGGGGAPIIKEGPTLPQHPILSPLQSSDNSGALYLKAVTQTHCWNEVVELWGPRICV